MKKFFAIAIAVCIGLCALSTFASAQVLQFRCKEVADNARDHQIRLRLSSDSASLFNYMGDGRGDEGKLKSAKLNGDYLYKGFPSWVDNGVADSGYLYVPAKLLKSGRGSVMLYSRVCAKDACANRNTKLSCRL
jgi:hypothetical protein